MSDPIISLNQANTSTGPILLVVLRNSASVRMTASHSHERGQLLGATAGLLSADAGNSRWVVPATHAVWIPPNINHGLKSHGPFLGWSVYVAAPACLQLPHEPCVLEISSLLREAIVRAASWKKEILNTQQERIASVILDEIQLSQPVPLGLPMPRDSRLLKITQALSDRPDDRRKLNEWAEWAGVAPRTLTRRFITETGFNFTAWRQRVRILKAMEMLASGRSVTSIALDLGYDNVSSFIAMFRKVLGITPGRYEHLKTLHGWYT